MEPASSAARARAALALVVAALVAAALWPSLGGGFVWDDHELLLEHDRWRGLSPEHLGWMLTAFHNGHWHPLTWLSWAVDHAAYGMEPRGYHRTNVLLHAANAGLVALLALLLWDRAGLRADRARIRLAAAGATALAWGVHPLRVESVAWVTERRDVLSTLFLLVATLAWLRARVPDAGARTARRWSAAALAAFALSLLAKAWGITLPAVLFVLAVWPLALLRTRGWRPVLAGLAPYVALAAVAAMLALGAQRAAGAALGGAQHPLGARLAQAAYGLVWYPARTVWPTDLHALHPLRDDLSLAHPVYGGAALLVVAVTAGLVALRRRWPAGLAAWAAYGILVSPVLGLAQSGQQLVADRYAYVATLPLLLLAGAGLALVARRAAAPALAAAAAVALVLAWRARALVPHWRDDVALWTRSIAVEESATAWYDRGLVYARRGLPDVALSDFDEALRLAPDYAEALANRGTLLLLHRRDARAALRDLDRALALGLDNPELRLARARARAALGDRDGARSDYARALAAAPPGWPPRPQAERELAALGG